MNISLIFITYEPDNCSLMNTLYKFIEIYNIYIIDNSKYSIVDKLPKKISCHTNFHFLKMRDNVGIATAQNIGASLAFENGATDIIFFDQDSTPSSSFVHDLLLTRADAENRGFKVGAVGPQQLDPRTNSLSRFIYIDKFKIRQISTSSNCSTFCLASFLIASGCLIAKDAWETIGSNEDDLFIDCVDLEWGFRATAKGYHCIGSFKARMDHCIGDKHINICGRNFTYHTPVRHYYFYRNFYRLLQRSYVPFAWKFHVFFKSLVQAFVFSIFSDEKKKQFSMITKGIWHGVCNRKGPYR